MDNCEYIKFQYDTSKQYPLNGFGGVIYCFTSPSNKMYIGKSINFYRKGKGRVSDYFCYSCKSQSAFYNALMKYKIENFKVEILCHVMYEHELDEMEKYYIALWNTNHYDYGYNLTDGGDGGKKSDETIKKMSLSNKDYCKNKKIYELINLKTGEEFIGTQNEFIKKYNLCKVIVSALLVGKRKTAKKWILKSNVGSLNEEKYNFTNIITKENLYCTKKFLSENRNISMPYINDMLRGVLLMTNFWILSDNIKKSKINKKYKIRNKITGKILEGTMNELLINNNFQLEEMSNIMRDYGDESSDWEKYDNFRDKNIKPFKFSKNHIFTFINKNTKEEFTGTRTDFRLKYKISVVRISELVLGKVKCSGGWMLKK